MKLIAIGLLALTGAGIYLSRGGSTPSGQPPLVELADSQVPELKSEFNRAADRTRVLLLMAPTCPYCLKGAADVQRILESRSDLAVFVVWEPILPTDWAKPRSFVLSRVRASNVHQYWDPDAHVSAALKKTGIEPNCCDDNGVLWDMVAVFSPGDRWEDAPPKPSFADGIVTDVLTELEQALGR